MTAVTFQFNEDDKAKYAAALLRATGTNKAFDAAITVFGTARELTGKCAYVASEWPADVEVIEETRRLIESGDLSEFLPTKDKAAHRIWKWTEEGDIDSKIKAMRLLAEVSGWISKPEEAVNASNKTPPGIKYELGKDHHVRSE